MSFVAAAVVGITAAAAIYSSDQQRKGLHQQQDALRAAEEADARNAAEAETGAAVAANAKLAEDKRRRRLSALGLGGGADTLGGPQTVLAAGSAGRSVVGQVASSAVSYGMGTTALGAGGRTASVPRTPPRSAAI